MRFVFSDKTETEADIITTILSEENIPYRTREKICKFMIFTDDDAIEEIDEFSEYDIICETTFEYFQFIKKLAYQKISTINSLEKCYEMKVRKRNVQRVHQKDTADSDSGNKGK